MVVYSKLCSICRMQKPAAASTEDADVADADVADPDVADADVNEDTDDNDDDNDDDDDDAIVDKPIIDDDRNGDGNDDESIMDHRCQKNFAGSMESVGAVELVTRAWKGNKYWVQHIVGNDDSTSHVALTTDLKQYGVNHPNKPKESYWPKQPNKDGRMVFTNNKGKLHWSVRLPQSFLCDPTHQQRVIGKQLYAMVAQMEKMRVTRAEAMRLKRNVGYAHKQSLGKTFDEYKTAMKGALLHHSNEHSCCDPSWCKF